MPNDDLPDLKATGKVNGGSEVTYLQPYVGGKDAEVEGKERPNTASKGVQADEDPLLPSGQGGRIAVSTRLLEQTGFECFRLSNLLRRLPLDLCDLSASSPLLRAISASTLRLAISSSARCLSSCMSSCLFL